MPQLRKGKGERIGRSPVGQQLIPKGDWWKNSAKLISIAFPIGYFDQLGMPKLAS